MWLTVQVGEIRDLTRPECRNRRDKDEEAYGYKQKVLESRHRCGLRTRCEELSLGLLTLGVRGVSGYRLSRLRLRISIL